MKKASALLCAYLIALTVAVAHAHAAGSSSVQQTICRVFGPYCSQALNVAWCESRFNVNATNGQYVNLFQMGYHERQTYGWHVAGSPAAVAARAAYRYFVASGYSWRAWSCKP